ncbi:MAG: hypothetical protein K5927_00065 [Lachnospiraceae bacterium]|nr:hypothetical protein [Lachnospiraceae bacterium]
MKNLRFSVISKSDKVSLVSIILLSAFIIIFETPIVSRNIPNVIFYGLMAVLLLLNVNVFLKTSKRNKLILLVTAAFVVLFTVYKVLKISSSGLSYYSTTVKFLLLATILIVYYDILSPKQKCFLLNLTVVAVIVNLIENLRLYFKYGPFRFVYLFQRRRFTTNSVSTMYVTAVFFFSAALFVYFLHTDKKKPAKWISLILSVFMFFFCVAIAQRTIILLLGMIMFPLLIVANAKNKRQFFIILATFTVIIVLLWLFYKDILTGFAKLTRSSRIQTRVDQLISYLSSGGAEAFEGSGAARMDRIMTSVHTWLSSPVKFFFGAGDHRGSYDIIGNHSQIVDEFAKYGLIGGLLMLYIIWLYFKHIAKSVKTVISNPLFRQLLIIFFIIFIRACIGGIFEPVVGVQLFLIIPFIFEILEKRKEEKIKTADDVTGNDLKPVHKKGKKDGNINL